MPFTNIPKNPGDLIKSEDWNKTLTALVELFGKFDKVTGHQHSASGEDAPQIKEAGIAANAVSNAKILDGAITNNKIQAGTITSDRVAAGTFARNIGIAIMPTVSNGQTIPPPSGFLASECIFFAAAKFVSNAGVATWSYNVSVDANGKVTIGASNVTVAATGLAMAKKGGW
jgi:hypothetical protein